MATDLDSTLMEIDTYILFYIVTKKTYYTLKWDCPSLNYTYHKGDCYNMVMEEILMSDQNQNYLSKKSLK